MNDGIGKPIINLNNKVGLSYEDMLMDDFVFDMDSRDVMVFLHMQKTGKYLHKINYYEIFIVLMWLQFIKCEFLFV